MRNHQLIISTFLQISIVNKQFATDFDVCIYHFASKELLIGSTSRSYSSQNVKSNVKSQIQNHFYYNQSDTGYRLTGLMHHLHVLTKQADLVTAYDVTHQQA